MTLTASMYWIVCPLALLAGFVDSIAGGGGLISLPAYYLAGLNPALAAGTNKLSSSMGTVLATVTFHKAGKIDRTVGWRAAVAAFLCSAAGALIMTTLPDQVVRVLVLCCIPIAAVFTLKKRPSETSRKEYSPLAAFWISIGIGCTIGFYDGMIGPGAGTFLILLFLHIFGMDAVQASGTAKLVNLASNSAALVSLFLTGHVLWLLGLPAGLCAMSGAALGSRLTIRKGGKVVRLMMLIVLVLLLAKVLVDMIG